MDDEIATKMLTVLEEIRDDQRRLADVAEARLMRDIGPMVNGAGQSSTFIAMKVALRIAARWSADDTANERPVPKEPTRKSPTPIDQPPDLTHALAVLMVSEKTHDAVTAANAWIGDMPSQIFVLDTAEERLNWTRRVRIDSDAIRFASPDRRTFVAGPMEVAPANWLPAFDIIAVVRRGPDGSLSYELLKNMVTR
jgi:hypothetical protein